MKRWLGLLFVTLMAGPGEAQTPGVSFTAAPIPFIAGLELPA